MNLNNRYIWQSWFDETITCETSGECKELAEKFPEDHRFRRWFQVLDFFEDPPTENP